MNKQRGFSAVELLLVILGVGILGGIGWYVYQENNKPEAESSKSSTSNTASNTPTNKQWVDGSMEEVDVSFKYPKGWKLTTTKNEDPDIFEESITITAPDKSHIILTTFDFRGGFSGDEPADFLEEVIKANDYSAILVKGDEYECMNVFHDPDDKHKQGDTKQLFISAFNVKSKSGGTHDLYLAFCAPDGANYKSAAQFGETEVYEIVKEFLNNFKAAM